MDNQFSLDQIRSVLKQVVDEATHLSDYEKQVLKGQVERMSEKTLRGVAKEAIKPPPANKLIEDKNHKAAIVLQKMLDGFMKTDIPTELQVEAIKNFLNNQDKIIE